MIRSGRSQYRHPLVGHLAEGPIRPSLEIILREALAHLQKHRGPETRLAFIHP